MKLFYSYSHEDEDFRNDIEKHLKVLKKSNLIDEWHDGKILPGSKFNDAIRSQIQSADIILLLLSSNFLASSSCKREMDEALSLSTKKGVVVIPIVLSPCAWKDVEGISELLALPTDGKPVTDSEWNTRDAAFLNIYEGIKSVVKDMEFSIKASFRDRATEIEFISQNKADINLDDIFVFPNIVHITDWRYHRITNFNELWNISNNLILQGDERSGKTIICKKLFFECLSNNAQVVMISGREIRSPKNHDSLIQKNFSEQFHGNYQLWKKKKNKTIIIDDLDSKSRIQFLDFAKKHFDRIFIVTSEDNYLSYFRDEERLANYELLAVKPFGQFQQEFLIRRWKSLSKTATQPDQLLDGEIDQIEHRLNSIIINNKIVPRYPFYILSILQIYEGFMPQDMRITAYGHCYQALITAQLAKCGIQKDDIDSSFNFLTEFAFNLFSSKKDYLEADFNNFALEYQERFVIKKSVINRLKNGKVIIADQYGKYQLSYAFVYYFFLGLFFAKNYKQHNKTVENLVEKSYLHDHRYILIFTIHHTHDEDLIDTILLHTMASMEHISIAKLTQSETKPLVSALIEIPSKIISKQSVEEANKAYKDQKDKIEGAQAEEYEETEVEDVNSIYKSLKNMEILGQMLKNKYGSFTKDKLREIVTTIADAGLRIVTFITNDKSIRDLEDYLIKKVKEAESLQDTQKMEEHLRRQFRAICFFTIAGILHKIVDSVQKPELAEVVAEVCKEENTPAYDLIDFFFILETAAKLQTEDIDKMNKLVNKFDKDENKIPERLLSLVTQDHLNRHNVQRRLRQRIYNLLNIKYQPNLKAKNSK